MTKREFVYLTAEVRHKLDHSVREGVKISAEEELANAIIIQAAEDYREVAAYIAELEDLLAEAVEEGTIKSLNFRIKIAMHKLREVEDFFKSDWFKVLTKADHEMIMEGLREECGV